MVLTPKMFNKILRLSFENKILHPVDANTFLSSQESDSNVLREFILPYKNSPTNLSIIDINLLQEPLWDFSWLFACVDGFMLTSHIAKSALYALHFFHFSRVPCLIGKMSYQVKNKFI
jgi:hypothetical protein